MHMFFTHCQLDKKRRGKSMLAWSKLCSRHGALCSCLGTEKQAVADDYYLQLYKGTVACENLASNLLSSMIKGKAASAPQLFQVEY